MCVWHDLLLSLQYAMNFMTCVLSSVTWTAHCSLAPGDFWLRWPANTRKYWRTSYRFVSQVYNSAITQSSRLLPWPYGWVVSCTRFVFWWPSRIFKRLQKILNLICSMILINLLIWSDLLPMLLLNVVLCICPVTCTLSLLWLRGGGGVGRGIKALAFSLPQCWQALLCL